MGLMQGSGSSAPTITGIFPSYGNSAGGTTVNITGTNFTPTTQVMFGGTPATSVTYNSPTSLTAVTPAGTVGSISGVTVVNSAKKFTFWTPASLPGIQAWFDATQITGLANGANVASWQELINGWNAVEGPPDYTYPTYNAAGMNGLPAVQFVGGALTLPSAALGMLKNVPGATIVAVMSIISCGSGYSNPVCVVLTTGTSTAAIRASLGFLIQQPQAIGNALDTDPNMVINYATQCPLVTPAIIAATFNYSSPAITLYQDSIPGGTTTGSMTAGNTSNTNSKGGYLCAMPSDRFNGLIGEIIICNQVTSADNLALLNAYLSQKWGIAI